ncbi:MAG: Glycosyl transferase group 1, partial [Candidatus Woesebacteria bacterium GW2011_GWB1_45_5]
PLPFPVNWLVGLIGYLGEPVIFLFYRNTKFMTGSESAKKELVKLGIPEKNINIVPHGVITSNARNSIPANEKKQKTVSFLGILSRDKGIEGALKCFALLAERDSFIFWVIGRAETESYKKHLEALVKTLGLEKKVKFWGFVSQKKKFELLAKSGVMINPSIREGWGLVNIEANAMGIPVVAYNSLGLTDSVKDGVSGVIVKRNTPKDLADTVEWVLSDKTIYKKLSEGAVSWSKEFSWDRSRKISLKVITSVIGKWS